VSGPALVLRQVRFTNKAFWRNPASAFFTFAFPLMFLVIFTSLLGSGTVPINGVPIQQDRYYLFAMMSFAVITASYTNLAMSVTYQRDSGILKRVRGTPLPGSTYLAGRVLHAMAIAILLVVITSVFGVVVFGTSLPTGAALGRFVATVLVGAASFAALGLATTAAIPNADAAPAMVNAIILPLLFLSGVFIPIGDNAPLWIRTIGRLFPVRHFADAMGGSFYGAPLRFDWLDVLVVAVWGLAGLLIAARFFSWEPRR
jgi:ABC-2 type transport system permease protein